MPRTGWTPAIVPYGADQTAYLVIDRFGGLGSVYRADLETIISDLMSGQFNDPIRIVAFNTLEHRPEGVSKDIAREIQTRCDIEGEDVLNQSGISSKAMSVQTANWRCGSHDPVTWSRKFTDPIELPKGKKLVTLRDAALYVTKLPKAEHDADEWQAAMEALILVAELDGPTMFARIGVMRAINRHVERLFDSSRKDHHWGRRKLARDQ
jgi:hypothetical protein